MSELFTRFILRSQTPIESKMLEAQLNAFEQEHSLKLSINATDHELKLLFKRNGYLLENELHLAKLQQALENVLSVDLYPVEIHTEDTSHYREQRAPKFYSRKDLQDMLRVSRQRISVITNEPRYNFPKPVYEKGHTVLWKAKEVEEWIPTYSKNHKNH